MAICLVTLAKQMSWLHGPDEATPKNQLWFVVRISFILAKQMTWLSVSTFARFVFVPLAFPRQCKQSCRIALSLCAPSRQKTWLDATVFVLLPFELDGCQQ